MRSFRYHNFSSQYNKVLNDRYKQFVFYFVLFQRAHVLVAAVERATANFVERGRSIAQENPEIEPEMLQAVDEVLKTGEVMSSAAREFASDPCSSVRRGNMVSQFPLRFHCV